MNAIGMHYGFWSHNWDEIQYIPLIEKVARLGFDVCEVASSAWSGSTIWPARTPLCGRTASAT